MTQLRGERMPAVSVIMPVYNGEAFVGDAIRSILDQTFRDFELIVVDDGSTDRTADILAKFNDSRVRVIRNAENLGITKTRNIAMGEARGQFIAVLDADDIADPFRLEMELDFMRRNPDHAMVATWAEYVNEDGSPAPRMPIWKVSLPGECAASILLFQNFICHSSVMLRASMLPDPVYRDLEPSEDYDLWVRLAHHHRINVIPRVLVQYRLHGQNVSKTREQRQQATSFQIVCAQLERLGLKSSPAELELHHKMFWDSSFQDRRALVNIRRWLERIRRANYVTGIYEAPALEKTLRYQWIKSCKCACKRNPLMVLYCAVSPVGRNYRWAFVQETLTYLGRRFYPRAVYR